MVKSVTCLILIFCASFAEAATQSVSGALITASTISTASPIVDSGLHTWKLAGDGSVSKNGVQDKSISHIIAILYYHEAIYLETSAYTWVVYNGSGWTPRNSLGDPRVISLAGAKIPKATELIDSGRNVWTLISGQVYKNGAVDKTITGTIGLLYFNNEIFQESSTYTWKVYSGGTWVARNSLGDPRVASASGTSYPTNSLVIDSARNVWTVINGIVYENGVPAGTTSGVVSLEYYNGLIYQENAAKLIWSWDGSSWIGANSVEFALPAQVRSLGYTNNILLDEFNNLDTIDVADTRKPGYNWYVTTYFDTSTTPARNITSVNYEGISALRLDGSGSAIVGAQKYNGETIGKNFSVRKNGGAYFEANIAYGNTGAKLKGVAWPAFWASSTAHILSEPVHWYGETDGGILHYVEFDFMEYFTGNTSNNYNSTLIDWYGAWNRATAACALLNFCKAQATQNLGPGKAGYFTSTESNPIFHKYGALWVPSVLNTTTISIAKVMFSGS